VPARDRRTVGELLAHSDAVSRDSLLEVLTSQGPATVRTWARSSSQRLDCGRYLSRYRLLRRPDRV
jgi:hypothetical protein